MSGNKNGLIMILSFVFNIPLTAKVIWKSGDSLKFFPRTG